MVGRDGPMYLPILKSRQGEMKALAQLEFPDPDRLTPLIELVDETVTDGRPGKEFDELVERLVKKVAQAWPSDGRGRVIVDTAFVEVDTLDEQVMYGHADLVDPEPVTPVLMYRLHRAGVHAVPVIRLSDPEPFREALRSVVHGPETGACLRLTGEDLDDTIDPLNVVAMDLLDEYGLNADDVDLVLDFGAVDNDDQVAIFARLARFVLPVLQALDWRSFAVASGAFPVDLSEVQAFSIAGLPRRDRELFLRLNAARMTRGLDYSDYAVTHPRLQTGVAFAAPPQIRYTISEDWLVSKGRRTDPRGHRQFFELCDRIRREHPAEIAAPGSSWGDQRFHEAADKAGTNGTEPGNASTWRAIGTSHHIATVLRRLNYRGEP